MTYDTLIKTGRVVYTVRELMKQVVSANTLTEAHDKAYWIQKALMTDYNQEIHGKLDEILKEFHNEPFFSIVQTNSVNGVEPPPFLTNEIFVTELKSSPLENQFIYIDMDRLWCWIYNNLVRQLKAKYEWLALFLFAKGHGLILKEIDAKKFCTQMNSWFKDYTTDSASYPQVNCYQAGFFRSADFNYRKWVEDNYCIPSGNKLRKDQKKEGFERIHDLCISLENNYDFNSIQVKDSNR